MKVICENLTKSYFTADKIHVEAVKNCSAAFESGKITCIMGVSGSGKSTLLGMLALDLEPDSGKIYFDGIEVSALSEKEKEKLRSEVIGYIPQSLGLVDILTAKENILLPHIIAGRKRKLDEVVINRLGIGDVLDRLPDEMSGGQKQRTVIAREFMRKPQIFLADEPTAALDSENIAAVMELFCELRDCGCAVILTTHDKRLCEYADIVYRMTDGVSEITRNQGDS